MAPSSPPAPGGHDTVRAKGRRIDIRPDDGPGSAGPRKPQDACRATRESWDDDFLFERPSTSSLALPSSRLLTSLDWALPVPRRSPSRQATTSWDDDPPHHSLAHTTPRPRVTSNQRSSFDESVRETRALPEAEKRRKRSSWIRALGLGRRDEIDPEQDPNRESTLGRQTRPPSLVHPVDARRFSRASSTSSRNLDYWTEGSTTGGETSERSGDEGAGDMEGTIGRRRGAGRSPGFDVLALGTEGVRVKRTSTSRRRRLKKRAPESKENVSLSTGPSAPPGIYASHRHTSIPMANSTDSKPPSAPSALKLLRRISGSIRPAAPGRESGSFYNLISRSTSALHSLAKRSSSPAPGDSAAETSGPSQSYPRSSSFVGFYPSSIPSLPALPVSSLTPSLLTRHRTSASVDLTPKPLLFSRARSFSRPSKGPYVPEDPPSRPRLSSSASVSSVDETLAWTPVAPTRVGTRLAAIPGSSSSTVRPTRSPSFSTPTRTPIPVVPSLPAAWASHRTPLSPLTSQLVTSGSLSSLASKPSPSRSRTALPVSTSFYNFDSDFDFADTRGEGVPRRNSLSSLRIPSRIITAQARIGDDLERVREFARGVDDLKRLQLQYHQLLISASPPPTPPPSTPTTETGTAAQVPFPSIEALDKTEAAVERLRKEFQAWWEAAEALVDLGDGKEKPSRPSPAEEVVDAARARSVSLAVPASSPSAAGRPRSRVISASSIESSTSVAERQREMLRGVLTRKGDTLPTRSSDGPTRAPLVALLEPTGAGSRWGVGKARGKGMPTSVTMPVISPRASKARKQHTSQNSGGKGIRDFLAKLRSKAAATQDATPSAPIFPASSPAHQARSVSDPSNTSTPRSTIKTGTTLSTPVAFRPSSSVGSSSEEDWDIASTPPSTALSVEAGLDGPKSLRRHYTQSEQTFQSRNDSPSAQGGPEMMILTTQGMPALLVKIREVRGKCEECIVMLKGVTV